jgi:hypothetical protein
MLLLLLGSVKGAWCFQTGSDIEALDTMVSDCRDAVPTTCLTSERRFKSQNTTPTPSDCQACLDLSFEELVTTGIKTQGADLAFTPAIAYPHTSIIEFPKAFTLLSSASLPDHVFRSSLNIHRSIQSTILII